MISRYTARLSPPRNYSWTTPLGSAGRRFCFWLPEEHFERQELAPGDVDAVLRREQERSAFKHSAEPLSEVGGPIDIDLLLTAPDGTAVEFQVKSPDQPGTIVNHKIVDGENDESSTTSSRHAGSLGAPRQNIVLPFADFSGIG